MTFHLRFFCTVAVVSWFTFVAEGASTWEEWSDWSACSVSCGGGVRRRMRACIPDPRPGAKWCEGQYVEEDKCDTGVGCPVDGGWSEWSEWGKCSSSCGEGRRDRYRSCSDPIPEEGGKKCRGKNKLTETCVALRQCPRDGGWSPWSQWSKCSVTCGTGGAIHRYRACNNPSPVAEGKPCPGKLHETDACEAPIHCPVNGQWSEWTDWTACSATCGPGSRSRQRACDRPRPQHGGSDCDRTGGDEVQTVSCTAPIKHCPVHGGWSSWGAWRECRSQDCSSASAPLLSMRHRSCSAPRPAHNGSMCEGAFLEAGRCITQPLNCKVDGGWGEWSDWNCTANELMPYRKRACDSPAPAKGGKACKGKDFEFVTRDDKRKYRAACPQLVSDDEDFAEGSGDNPASGDGNIDDEEDDEE